VLRFRFIDHAEGLSYNQWQADYPLVAPAKPLLYVRFQFRDQQATPMRCANNGRRKVPATFPSAFAVVYKQQR
jgi:hypothetical protein